MRRLIISFYDNFSAAHEAVKVLMEKGYCLKSISLIVHKAVWERVWDRHRSESWFFVSKPATIHLQGIGPVLVSGFCASDFKDHGSGSQSMIPVLESYLVPKSDAHAYTEGVRRRGILVIVRTESANANKVLTILDSYCPVDILDLTDYWRKNGWTHFDDTAKPQQHTLNWPNCITSLPGDALLENGAQRNWPQSIMGQTSDDLKDDKFAR